MTRIQDALAAASLGVDAIGLIIGAESLRKITPDQARQIVSGLPPMVTPIALFLDQPPQIVREHSQRAGVRCVQLHGNETRPDVETLVELSALKVLRVSPEQLQSAAEAWVGVTNVSGLLFDTPDTVQAGGTGLRNNFEAIADLKERGAFKRCPPIVIAGGLKPETVGAVVRLLRPWAVDVSSGIESAPGIKSLDHMKAFVDAVREADAD